jgi:uncharacterized membrane protein
VADETTFSGHESAKERAFDYDRTVALSDGVFAIALTLLVLSLTVPHLRSLHTGVLGNRLVHKNGEYLSYAISFAVIGLLWVRHHLLFRTLRRIDGRVTALNLTYLAFVAFLPFPTRILGIYGQLIAAVVLYALTIAILGVLAGLMRLHVRQAGLVDPDRAAELRAPTAWVIAPAVFLASIPIAFVNTTLAKLFWLLVLAPTVAERLRSRARRRQT